MPTVNATPQKGEGVDSKGGPVVDPTRNVLDLVSAAVERLDDLRASDTMWADRLHQAQRARADHLAEAEQRRTEDLRIATDRLHAEQVQHLQITAELRAQHAQELRVKETERLDSIRQVDVTARNTATDRASDAIETLAKTTATNAENLRNALNATAATIAAQSAATVAGITERLAALEKSSYEGAGRQRVSDPILDALLLEVKTLRQTGAQTTGKAEGIGASWGALLGAASLVVAVLTAAALLLGR